MQIEKGPIDFESYQQDELAEQNLKVFKKKLKELLAKTISEQKFEQARILDDFIKDDTNLESLIDEADRSKKTFFLREDPRACVLEAIKETRLEYLWEGKERVAGSILSPYLMYEIDFKNKTINPDHLVLNSKEEPELRALDRFITLNSHRKEAESMVNLAREKFDNIWQPYRKKHNLSGSNHDEFRTAYHGVSADGQKKDVEYTEKEIVEQRKIEEGISDDLKRPLSYWQHVYDNSRMLLDTIDQDIKKIQDSHLI